MSKQQISKKASIPSSNQAKQPPSLSIAELPTMAASECQKPNAETSAPSSDVDAELRWYGAAVQRGMRVHYPASEADFAIAREALHQVRLERKLKGQPKAAAEAVEQQPGDEHAGVSFRSAMRAYAASASRGMHSLLPATEGDFATVREIVRKERLRRGLK